MALSKSVRPTSAGRSWSVGQHVWAPWEPELYFYPGVIKSVKDGKFHIHFDDGDEAWVSAAQMAEIELAVGQRVFARWQGGPGYFPATIDQRQGDRIHVRYDDGDEEWTTIGRIRVER